MHHNEDQLPLPQREKSPCSNKDPEQTKIKINKIVKKELFSEICGIFKSFNNSLKQATAGGAKKKKKKIWNDLKLYQNSVVATGLEKVSFHSNPKERQCQRMLKLLHNCTHLTC